MNEVINKLYYLQLIKEWSKLSEYGNNNMYPKLNNISMKESMDLGLIDL